ncbi:hypothetical protein [Pseudofrankia inefficax]|uniref:Uncharacterized protein n=1 Tax=Pseudofrankia inefficax (strain DSM 45817 / CECT 9037 / DDB 130130 / EuI1c) TaxID=298654 RepID=E3J6C9_PSEI1|nr:hypothetical protein [Pseudofrankia inefficax]ADP79556.1 hypothetical protein FraEuI1c_1494 [Pseudofrankia inefficax]
MHTHDRPDVETVETLLGKARRHGAGAAELARHRPDLVDLLTPPDGTSPKTRALLAERIIRAAIDRLDPPADSAMRALFGLTAETRRRSVAYRRDEAARLICLTPGAFRRPNREGSMILDIAFEIVTAE